MTRPGLEPIERFWLHVDRSDIDGCWLWTGSLTRGAAYFHVRPGLKMRAHRWLWEQVNGPLASGEILDHICHDPMSCAGGESCPHRRCQNLGHMRVTDQAGNLSTGRTTRGPQQQRAALERTHCSHGHPLSDRLVRGAERYCPTCARDATRRYRARRVAAREPRPAH